LIRRFLKVELVVNERARGDPLHAQNILKMRDVSAPIDVVEILKSYKTIDLEDSSSNEAFSEAVIAVAGNEERDAINLIRGEAYAIRNGRPMIQWRKSPTNPTALHNNEQFLKLYGYYPSATATFIEGAPSFISRNLNVSLGLANGTRANLHSLILDPKTAVADAALIASCSPGKIVMITEPMAVNVLIPNSSLITWPIGATIVQDGENVIIPLTTSGNDRNKTKIQVAKKTYICFKNFPVDLGFSRTYHKLQVLSFVLLIQGRNTRKVNNVCCIFPRRWKSQYYP
jgi:hypothetical protein